MWREYHTVLSLEQALDLLDESRERARIVAGGTDLLLELERGARPDVDVLIDVSRVPGMAAITADADGRIHLGAMVTHNDIVGNDLLLERALPLAQACWEVGAPQIRNRATIAGNLITASPANDTIPPLLAMNASVTLESRIGGRRVVPLAEFYTGYRRHVMRPDEMLVSVAFDGLTAEQRGVFLKLGLRSAQAISVINVAVVLTLDGQTVRDARITLGSVAPTIIRAPQAEAALIGQTLEPAIIADAAAIAADTPTPMDDIRGTAAYRVEMIRVLVKRALNALADDSAAPAWARPAAMLWGDHKGRGTTTTATHTAGTPIQTTINGQPVTLDGGHDKTLLDFLREDAGLPGTKEGCAEGECGACTVFLDGAAVMACMVPAPRAHNADVITVEGLADSDELHPVQQAFIDKGAVQCGYCTPGFIMSGAKLLEEHPQPTRAQALQSISGNLCRCTGYYSIIQALLDANKAPENGE